MDLQQRRDRILLETLPQVPFDGWTIKALRAGAVAAGRDPREAERAFPGGGLEMIAHFADLADRRMAAALAEAPLAAMRTPAKVALAVRTRLEQNAAHREAIRRALSILALPQNAPLAARLTYNTVGAIWYALGDKSADFSFYTKRASLGAVYAATVLYWLNDSSEGFADTWRFLERRLADVMRIPRLVARCGEAMGRLPDPFRLFRSFAERRRGR